jgi:uncharacterized phage-like protein YoqJ
MYPREISCCFTGHRPGHLPWGSNELDDRCLELKFTLSEKLEELYSRNFRHFICGMAKGCDFYFAEAVLALRDIHPDVSLEAAIPCPTQADRWAGVYQQRYQRLLSQCDEQHLVSQMYSPSCMQRRNEYMVDNSSLLLACFAGVPSGTMNTILYAQRHGVETIILDV